MSKNYARFVTALFCGFLGVVAAANALTPDKSFSELENRNLAQKPALTLQALLSGQFMSDYESYVTDQFAGRDGWTAAKAAAELSTGKQENNGVYFCADSTLITRFDTPDTNKVAQNINYVNRFAEISSVPVYFGLIPGAATVWADRLPQGAPNYDQRQVIDQAAQAAAATRFVDLYTPLMNHKGEDIFYRTDHHWTSLGAYYGYTGIAEALDLVAVPLTDYVKTTVSTNFYGTVFSSSGVRWVRPDVIDTYVPEDGITVTSYTYDAKGNQVEIPRQLYDESFLTKKDQYGMFLGGQQALGVVRTGHTGKPKLLLIRDSYSDSLVPFLTPHFSEIHLIDLRYYKQSAAQYIKDNGIDAAMVLYSVPDFVSETNLVWLGR